MALYKKKYLNIYINVIIQIKSIKGAFVTRVLDNAFSWRPSATV